MMKKEWKRIIAIMVTAAVCLSGCGKAPGAQDGAAADEVLNIETEKKDTSQTDYDVQKALEEAEKEASVFNEKLTEDSSLTQADMNELSIELYQVWDGILNEIWANLKATLDEETMESLHQEQQAWIAEKEAEVKQAGEAFAGGSMVPLAANQKAAELTRTRVYELASYLGFEG